MGNKSEAKTPSNPAGPYSRLIVTESSVYM